MSEPFIVDVPHLPALAEWHQRAERCSDIAKRLPLMTPEQAMAWTGQDLETLCRKVTHFKDGRTIRFFPEIISDYLAGRPIRKLTDDSAKKEPPKRQGMVYVIEAIGTDRVKIGFTDRAPETRRRQLQTASPFELRILAAFPGTADLERALHHEHAAERIMPTAEWFHHRGSVAEMVRTALIKRSWR